MLLMTNSDKKLLLTSPERRSSRVYKILVVVLLILLIGSVLTLIFVQKSNNCVNIISKNSNTNSVEGIDVSHYQGRIIWQDVAKFGESFTFIKATEGLSADSTFLTNFKGANNASLKVWAYHYAHPSQSSGSSQANYFISNGGNLTELGAIDLENYSSKSFCYGLSQQQMIDWLNDFISAYYNSMKNNPIIYTRTSWWNVCFGNVTWTPSPPSLWISKFGSSTGQLPNGFKNWAFWQYSQTGQVNGIKGDVDLDVKNGNLDWYSFVHKINEPVKIINNNHIKIPII